MHHHNYLITLRLKHEELADQDPAYIAHYFQLVVSHNYAGLALTLCKVMEFHNAFRDYLPEALRSELNFVNARLARSRILEYRNKYVGHLFDRKTKKPLDHQTISNYWTALLEGQNEEAFRAWWWSVRSEPELTSVAGIMARIADYAIER